MFGEIRGQKYFDESGGLGLLESGSNTESFAIAVYIEKRKEESVLLAESIRQELSLSTNTILKWNKLSYDRKNKFRKI